MTSFITHTAASLIALVGLAQPASKHPEAVVVTSHASPSTSTSSTLPDSPAGKIARAYLAAYNDASDAAQLKFEETYRVASKLKETPAAERAQRMKTMFEKTGTLAVEQVTPSDDGTFTARLKGSKGVVLEMHFVPSRDDSSKLDFVEVATFDTAPEAMTADQRAAVVEGAAKAMETGYVFPEKGAKMATTIREKLKSGGYDSAADDIALARAITTDLRAVSHDKHIGMGVLPPSDRTEAQPMHEPTDNEMARENYAFRKVERLEGNIGYLKFDAFIEDEGARQTALAALNFISHCDAIIFDLRQNGGGSPEMIRFITSSLFDKPTLLNQMMDRDSKIVEEFTTLADFAGPHFKPEVPVFVLTSGRTFSGAEEFSYNLKNLKRATIIGETTGGGAHPVRGERIADRFSLRVPYMRAYNPITKTNWEGTGVEPDVKVSADQALDKAIEIARGKIGKP